MSPAYYRLYFAEVNSNGTPVGVTRLFEVDEVGAPLRQLDLTGPRLGASNESVVWWARRFERVRPVHRNASGEVVGQMRAERLDPDLNEGNRISAREFEFSWAAGQLRERDFGEFKRELLVSAGDDIQGVHEAWLLANTWYPHHALSHRLGLAEQAVRELLAEGFVRLVTWGPGRDAQDIPGEQHDGIFRSFSTWVVTESVTVYFIITPSGSLDLGIDSPHKGS